MCIQVAIDNVKKYATNIAFSVKMSGVAIHDYAPVSRAIHTQLGLAIVQSQRLSGDYHISPYRIYTLYNESRVKVI